MQLSVLLSEKLKKSEFDIDSNGELPSFCRKQIHELIENLSLKEHQDAGYYRRAKLAIGCAYSCLKYLEVYPSAKSEAQNVIEKSILSLQNKFNMKELELINSRLYTDSENLFGQDEPNFKAIYSSFACVAAANTVLYDVDFAAMGITEKESDPSDWDASFYASLAHSGGAIWEDVGDADNRKNFWLWYLDKAIPYTWDTSTTIGPIKF